MENLRLVVLNDNERAEGLKNDWGWSIFLDYNKKILFDANSKGDIIEFNSKKLEINLGEINFAFLSHYHHDHYGGFEYVGAGRSRRIKVYVPEEDRILKDWNLDPVQVKGFEEIYKNVYSTGPLEGGIIMEQAIVLKFMDMNILIVGCSHPGIDRIAKTVYEKLGEIYLTIGGFHNPTFSQLEFLAKLSKYIAPAHCSGNEAKQYVSKKFPKRYVQIKTGTELFLPFYVT